MRRSLRGPEFRHCPTALVSGLMQPTGRGDALAFTRAVRHPGSSRRPRQRAHHRRGAAAEASCLSIGPMLISESPRCRSGRPTTHRFAFRSGIARRMPQHVGLRWRGPGTAAAVHLGWVFPLTETAVCTPVPRLLSSVQTRCRFGLLDRCRHAPTAASLSLTRRGNPPAPLARAIWAASAAGAARLRAAPPHSPNL